MGGNSTTYFVHMAGSGGISTEYVSCLDRTDLFGVVCVLTKRLSPSVLHVFFGGSIDCSTKEGVGDKADSPFCRGFDSLLLVVWLILYFLVAETENNSRILSSVGCAE